jgi:N-acetylmuramoyl-L-alanine amidase
MHRTNAILAAIAGLWLALPSAAEAQTAAARFADARAHEAAVWSTTPAPSLAAIRAAEKPYEALVLRYPSSGYSDNALLQAGNLAAAAFDRFGDPDDAKTAARFFEWLIKQYPSSSLIKEASTRLQSVRTPRPQAGTRVDPPASAPAPVYVPASATTPPPSPVPAPFPAATGLAAIRNITRTALPRGDRLTIEFSGETTYDGDRIANPDRVYFDFKNTNATAAVIEHANALGGTLIKSMRLGKRPDDSTRIVVELMDNPRFSVFPMYQPFRLVIDLERDGPAPVVAATTPAPVEAPVVQSKTPLQSKTPVQARTPTPPPQDVEGPPAPPSATSRGDYSLGRQLGLGVGRIVIDPGHGGHDPGAQANGIDEAELVLDVALRLEKLLKAQTNFDVVLTRRTDEFIPLEERTAIANRESADLFLSIHANASRDNSAKGLETYFLNFASNPAAEAVAARENAASGKTMGNLPEILRAIALNNKLAESRELAAMVQGSMVQKLKAQNAGVRDLGVKQAPFVVLIGAQMPSVLAEISFLTNKPEASLLKQPAYRQKIAQALCDAVVKYRASLKKITTVATKTDAK